MTFNVKRYALIAILLLNACGEEPSVSSSDSPAGATEEVTEVKSELDWGCSAIAGTTPNFWAAVTYIGYDKADIQPVPGSSPVASGCNNYFLTARGAGALAFGGIASACACKYVCGSGLDNADNHQCGSMTTGTATYDGSTSCTVSTLPGKPAATQTMHCCPAGMAMVGLNANQGGTLKCRTIAAQLSGGRFLDTATTRVVGGTNMKACPVGSVMVGFHGSSNRFACQAVTQAMMSEIADSTTQDWESTYSMHVCPAHRAMSAVHIGQNKFGCVSDTVNE